MLAETISKLNNSSLNYTTGSAESSNVIRFQPRYKIGINKKIIGKCGPDKVSYPGVWKTQELTLEQLAAHIGAGHPWMPATLDANTRRWQVNSNYTAVLGADIDKGMTIAQALEHPFITAHCGLLIESASSSTELNKFRLVFPLVEPLTNWKDIALANRYLIKQLAIADDNCKDASRFFFGAPGRTHQLLNDAAALPADFLQQAIAWQEAEEAIAKAKRDARQNYLSTLETDSKLDLVKQALEAIPPYSPGNGTYNDLITMCAGVVADLGSDGERLLEAWDGFGSETAKKVRGLANSTSGGKSAGVGTLFWLAKQHGFRFPELTSEQKREFAKAKQGERDEIRRAGGTVVPFVRPEIIVRLANRVKRTPDLSIGSQEFKERAHEFPRTGLVAFVGGKGTGKSEAINILKGDRPWLSVTHRRSIGRDQAAGWGGVFLQDGDRFGSQPLTSDGSPASGTSVCVPSLLSAGRMNGEIFIIDETTAVLEFILGSKLCNKDGSRPLLTDELHNRIRDAKLVVLADADLTEEAIAYIEAIRGERAYLVRSERQPLGYAVHNMTENKYGAAIGEFIRQAQEVPAGEMIYLNSDSKALVNALESVLTEYGIKSITITQDNSGEDLQRSLIGGKGRNLPEFAMMGIKVILSSPSITQGFSLTQNTDRIVSRWGVYLGNSISAQDIAQAPDRIRSDAPLYLWVAARGRAYSRLGRATNQKQFLKDFESVSTTSARLVRHSLSAITAAAVDAMDYQSRNLSMLASIEVSRNLGMTALRDTVLAHLRLEGKRIEEYDPAIDSKEAAAWGKTIATATAALKEAHGVAVEKAPDRTDDEIKALEKKAEKKALDLEERLSIEKYYLGIFYRLQSVKALDVMLDRDGRTRTEVRNLERVLDVAKGTAHTAESIDRNASTPQDWSKAALQSWVIDNSGAGDLIRGIWSGEITKLTTELVAPIFQYIQKNPKQFEKAFGWGGAQNISTMKAIGVILDWVGIDRTSSKKRVSGKLTRIYAVDAQKLEWLKNLVGRRSHGEAHVDTNTINMTCASPQNSVIDLAEWRDFIESERQKPHSPDSLRAMSSQMDFVPSTVWEAIAA
jgi:hypothetical protein